MNLAKQLFLELTYRQDDKFNSTRAEYELIKLRLEAEEIDIEAAIKSLIPLTYKWRGDQIEYEILIQLAFYYKKNADILNALRTYKYIQTVFSNKVSNFYVTSEMAKIFNEVFLPDGIGKDMDDFTIVALFYEFKELNPIGEKGDDIIIEIARRLVKLDLLENAADLLRHQIKFRLKGQKRVINADNLAVLLMMDKKPKEAIFVLDETDRDNFSYKEYEYRLRLRARAMIDFGQHQQAIELLINDDSKDADLIRKEALFRSEQWQTFADLVARNLNNIINQLSINDSVRQDILRLGIAYYMLGSSEELQSLINLVDNKNPILKNTLQLLITSFGEIDVKNLDKSLNIDQMQNLLTKYKNQFLDES